jgi:autotransporter-associated beta strand protein
VTINPTAATWANGSTYDLISYGGGSIGGAGFGQFALGTVTNLTGRQIATIGSSGTAITMSVTGDTAYWVGDTDNKWNTTTVNNWKLLSNNTYTTSIAQDDVQFGDNASGVGTVTVDIDLANVAPAATVFNNSTRNYVLSSSGAFGISSGTVTKNGTGTVTISTDNTYTGATTISGGTLQIGAGGTTGTLGSGAVLNDAALVFNRSNQISVSNVISGSGSVTNAGSGTLEVLGNNTYSGGTFITAGALLLRTDTTGRLGSGTVTIASGANYQIWAPSAVTLTNAIVLNGPTGNAGRPALNQDGGLPSIIAVCAVVLILDCMKAAVSCN